jgi:hypothetical protein
MYFGRYLFILSVLVASACGPSVSGADIDAAGVGPDADPLGIDASAGEVDAADDAGSGTAYGDGDTEYPDGGVCVGTSCSDPVAFGCGSTELCGDDFGGDGLDNDCNAVVDEGCGCNPGNVKSCFLGPPGRRGIGACQDGQMRCLESGEFGVWGPCEGGIRMAEETCDSLDNDCNGCDDDNPSCCDVELSCPGPAEAAPFQDFVINGRDFYNGAFDTWTWTVMGGPCDQLTQTTVNRVSYTTTGANTPTLTFRPTLSGDYTITMTVTRSGETFTCTFLVHVKGPGLRIELCWDKTGETGADIDLHMHRSGTTTDWATVSGGQINNDDCFYQNCKARPYLFNPGPGTSVDWGYSPSPLSECEGGPEGSSWASVTYCRNPRLDIDNVQTLGTPENINLDVPRIDEQFRVMVHYYDENDLSNSKVVRPLVNIYCGGHLKTTYGAAPDTVPNFNHGDAEDGKGPMWRVADVVITGVDAAGDTTCDVKALHSGGDYTGTGYHVTEDDKRY